MPSVERQNARAEYERGWREGAEAMRIVIDGWLYDTQANLRDFMVTPEPPKEEEPKLNA